jgi:hypothetical protein
VERALVVSLRTLFNDDDAMSKRDENEERR